VTAQTGNGSKFATLLYSRLLRNRYDVIPPRKYLISAVDLVEQHANINVKTLPCYNNV